MRLALFGVIVMLIPFYGIAQHPLKNWEGEWKGEMIGYQNGQVTYRVHSQMLIQPSKRCNMCWDWTTTYYKDSILDIWGVVIKDYWMEVDSTNQNRMILHEPDPDASIIRYECFGLKLIGGYSVLDVDSMANDLPEHQTLFHTQYELKGDSLLFDLSYFQYENKAEQDELSSNIRAFIPIGQQQSILYRSKK